MRIPNSFITDLRSNYTDFAVACKLYSLVSSHTKRSSNGYEVCIKQETIAASCKCSVSSVKRSVCRLEEMGIITHKYRLDGSEGRFRSSESTVKPRSSPMLLVVKQRQKRMRTLIKKTGS